jgi:hypothetical protein
MTDTVKARHGWCRPACPPAQAATDSFLPLPRHRNYTSPRWKVTRACIEPCGWRAEWGGGRVESW